MSKAPKRVECDHLWLYVHTVYSNDAIRRWCGKCGHEEYATAKNWRIPPDGMFENTAEDDAAEVSAAIKEGDE